MPSLIHAFPMIAFFSTTLPAQSGDIAASQLADSISVQRTACLGSCPAYRLSVRADGFVRFVSHNRGDAGRVESRNGGPEIMRRIDHELKRTQFNSLPEIVMGRGPYCRLVATDAPTITVSVFSATRMRTVSYYMGCIGESTNDTTARSFTRRLRALADSIDAMAAGEGWIRPAR